AANSAGRETQPMWPVLGKVTARALGMSWRYSSVLLTGTTRSSAASPTITSVGATIRAQADAMSPAIHDRIQAAQASGSMRARSARETYHTANRSRRPQPGTAAITSGAIARTVLTANSGSASHG